MDVESAIAHGVSALAGGSGATIFVRFFFKNWQKHQDRQGKVLERIAEMLARLDERVKTLQENDRTTEHAVDLAILKERTEKHRTDINGLGAKLREYSNGG